MKRQTVFSTSFSRLLQLVIAVPISLALPSAGQAAGLTGSFAPVNWVLSNTNADETFSSPQNTCAALSYQVACVTINDALTGSFDVIGSADSFDGGANTSGAPTTDRTTTWKLVNTGLPAYVSFKWLFSNGEDNTDIASYLIGTSETILSDVPSVIASPIVNLTIASNSSIAFRVRTTDNSGNPASLSITNFDAVPVPAPLPLLGVAVAFGWSRKLRRRLKRASRFNNYN
jgi:hypothetical protein